MHAVEPDRERSGGELVDRLEAVRSTIETACRRVDRKPSDVDLVVVTKGHPVEVLRAVLASGLREVAENRVHEARDKFELLADDLDRADATRHMVGHLQRNKVRDAVRLFDWIQSVDSMRLAQALSARLEDRALQILVQVNAAGEEQKYGFEPEVAVDRALEIGELPGLEVRGLMGMAPWVDDASILRAAFGTLRRCFETLREQWPANERPDTLSMGMSNDYEIAIEEGATMIRLGTALLGPRPGRGG